MEDTENFSFSLLGPGLGFYEKKLLPDREKPLALPELQSLALSEDFDLEDESAYEHLLSVLEKPYLGEQANFSLGSSEFLPSVNSSPVVSPFKAVPTSSALKAKNPSLKSQNLSSLKRKKEVPVKKVKPVSQVYLTFCFSLKAYLIDAFVVSLLFFPPLLFFTFLTEPLPLKALMTVWPQVLMVFFLFAQGYCFLCRLFCFETFGEAFSKIRLFTLRSQSEVHPLRLFWRFLLSCLTGMLLIPLFSLVFKKDIMARLTGLYFQKT